MMKKIVVTTRRVLLFEALSNKLKEAEYELSAPFGRKASSKSKTKSRDYRISTNWLP